MSIRSAQIGTGNTIVTQHLPPRDDMVHRATYSVRFRLLQEDNPIEFDEDEDEELPQMRYRHGQQFSALMRVMVGPPLDKKRHVTLSMWLVPNIEIGSLASGCAGMPIEQNSNIVIERGVISTFCTNAITVPCCEDERCNRRALLFPSMTIFVEWSPCAESVEYILEPSTPISSLYVAPLHSLMYKGTYTSVTRRANEIVPGYYPDAPAEPSAKARIACDDAARRARIKERQRELAEQRSRKVTRPCTALANDDEREAEGADMQTALARSRSDVGGARRREGGGTSNDEVL